MSLNPETDHCYEHRVDELTREITAQVEGLQSLLASLQRECEEMRKENRRWRWVRVQLHGEKWRDLPEWLAEIRPDPDNPGTKYVRPEELDDAIDAAMHADEEGR